MNAAPDFSANVETDWLRANQAALSADIGEIATLLALYSGETVVESRARPDVVSALDLATERLGLTSFERKIVVMCAAIELESSFGERCAKAQHDASRPYPTFGLALAAFEDAYWSALAPTAPLRRFDLIQLQRGAPLTTAILRIDEAFVHNLAGVGELDARLAALLTPVPAPHKLVASQAPQAKALAGLYLAAPREAAAPCIQLLGADRYGKQQVAAHGFARLDLCTYALDAAALVNASDEIDSKARAWEREARLRRGGLYIDAHDLTDPREREMLACFLDRFTTPVVIATRHQLRCGRRLTHVLDVGKPTRGEQRELWTVALTAALRDRSDGEPQALDSVVRRTAAQFDFDAGQIEAAVQRTCAQPGPGLGDRLWSAACSTSRNELSEIAERLVDRPGWEDLVLPPEPLGVLRDIVAHARNRGVVHDEWGMAERHGRGLGLGALFYGQSGTGKTLAAEVIGTELGLDVYRVDLSQLVSKYVGETEKNLRRVFDAAEGGGAVLLFDECDAIFGKRGEVEHGQDRYANMEVSYLLQRMESYRGIAILTTNLRSAIDPAFMRRLRFAVSFPFPDYERRIAIWKRALSPGVPLARVDFHRLARLNVAGGSIRNIALHAAFLAADAPGAVTMAHLRRAALAECLKLERTPSEVEMGGWL